MKKITKEYKCERWYGDFHKWSKWGEIQEGEWSSPLFKTSGTCLVQERKCEMCGKIEMRSI